MLRQPTFADGDRVITRHAPEQVFVAKFQKEVNDFHYFVFTCEVTGEVRAGSHLGWSPAVDNE